MTYEERPRGFAPFAAQGKRDDGGRYRGLGIRRFAVREAEAHRGGLERARAVHMNVRLRMEGGGGMAFLRTLKKAEVPDGTIREFQIEGKTLAISNVGGKVYAINNVCLHRGGPLGEGELARDVVTCPWHGWQYNVCTGKLVTNPAVGVETYPVEVRGDDIFVDIG